MRKATVNILVPAEDLVEINRRLACLADDGKTLLDVLPMGYASVEVDYPGPYDGLAVRPDDPGPLNPMADGNPEQDWPESD